MSDPEPFLVELPSQDITDMLQRVRRRDCKVPEAQSGWESEKDKVDFEALCEYWGSGFDWKKQQDRLNDNAQFTLEIDEVSVHFVHVRAAGGGGIPLILAHSWPSSFMEYVPLVPLLTDPAIYGLDGPGFDVVIPSVPGFGFSERPRGKPWTYACTAVLWHRLMCELGYSRYAAVGTGFGAGIVTMMALQQPERVIGIYLNSLDVPAPSSAGQALSTAEMLSLAQSDAWEEKAQEAEVSTDTGPIATKNMLAFALTDSPIGIAAWIVQQWRKWAGPDADLADRRDYDALLTMISLYWLTGTVGSSLLDYYDNRAEPVRVAAGQKVDVPTSATIFTAPEQCASKEWMANLYRLDRLIQVPRVGRFGMVHEPMRLSVELTDFVQDILVRGNEWPGGEVTETDMR